MAKGTIYTRDDRFNTSPNTLEEFVSYKNDGTFDYIAPRYVVDGNGNLIQGVIQDKTGDSAVVGIFGELVTGQKLDDIAVKFEYPYYNDDFDLEPFVSTGDGTQSISNGVLTITSATTGTAQVSSKNSVRYRAGHTGFIAFTASFTGTGIAKVGAFDDTDGFLLKYDNGNLSFGRSKGGVETLDDQSIWESTIDISTIDFTKINIFMIKFGYLGVASPELLIHNEFGWNLLHKQKTEGQLTTTTVNNPSFPIRMYVENGAEIKTGSWEAGVLDSRDTGAGSRPFTAKGSVTLSTTDLATMGTFENKTTYKTISNKVKATLLRYKFLVDAPASGTGTVELAIIKNATLSGTPSWVDIDTDNSVMRADSVQTYASGGQIIFYDYVQYTAGAGAVTDLGGQADFVTKDLGLYLLPGETATITAQNVAGDTNVTVRFLFDWVELF